MIKNTKQDSATKTLMEGYGLVYLEAMNYAKPVIGCSAGGVPEVIADGVTGKLVPPSSPDALGEAIASLLGSPEELRSIGLEARSRIVSHFSYLQMARRFADVYRKTIEAFAEGNVQGRKGEGI